MDVLTLLRDQAAEADDLLMQVFAPVTAEQGAWRLPGGTANAITPTFVHAYQSEDRLITRVSKRPPLFVTDGWGALLGFDPAAPWEEAAPLDPARCRDYARAVRAATEAFLAAFDPAMLTRGIATSRGGQLLGEHLLAVLVIHKSTHMGEIAALLGCQGARGFPF